MNYKVNIILALFIGYCLCMLIENTYEKYEENIHEIANQIATVFGLNKKLIKPISSETLNQKAIRPPNTGFNLSKIRRDLEFQPTSFLEGLKRFKQTLN